MSQFLNYITKKQRGGDISGLPGVLSLSGIQDKINLDKKKAAKRDPELRQYTPKPGDLEHQRKLREDYLEEQNSLVNRMMANPTFNKFMDNIVSPMITMSEVYGVGALGRMGLKAVGKAGKKAILSDPEITRGFIDWGDAVNYSKNPRFNPRVYERAFQGDYVPPTTDPKLMPRLFERKKGGPIVDSRGQWAHPGKRTIVPTPTGQITMQGVPYPVYGQDETGYGQLMMPGGEYTFPGQYVDEIPMMGKGGEMMRRADGSYSRRGLWDNIRANKGSGKKPTKQMLEQERKIKAQEKKLGGPVVGEEINVTPEQLETLRAQGYEFEII